MPKLSIQWFAGLFDGEGSCGCYYVNSYNGGKSRIKKKRPRIMCQIAMTHKYPLLKFKEKFGGNVYTKRSKTDNWKTAWMWVVQNRKAQEVLRELLPYLTVKRKAAKKCIAWDPWSPVGSNQNTFKTHCIRGHLLQGDNLYKVKSGNCRRCKLCERIRSKLKYKTVRNLG